MRFFNQKTKIFTTKTPFSSFFAFLQVQWSEGFQQPSAKMAFLWNLNGEDKIIFFLNNLKHLILRQNKIFWHTDC